MRPSPDPTSATAPLDTHTPMVKAAPSVLLGGNYPAVSCAAEKDTVLLACQLLPGDGWWCLAHLGSCLTTCSSCSLDRNSQQHLTACPPAPHLPCCSPISFTYLVGSRWPARGGGVEECPRLPLQCLCPR